SCPTVLPYSALFRSVMKALLYYWGARDYAPALAELALARRNLPHDMGVLYFTAMIERRQGNWLDSTRRLEQAFALDPCNISIISDRKSTRLTPVTRS